LDQPKRAALAAHALALMPGPEANAALRARLSQPKLRRLAARAAVLRFGMLGERVSGLEDTLEALLRSKDAADRAAAAFGLAALDPERGRALLKSRDLATV